MGREGMRGQERRREKRGEERRREEKKRKEERRGEKKERNGAQRTDQIITDAEKLTSYSLSIMISRKSVSFLLVTSRNSW